MRAFAAFLLGLLAACAPVPQQIAMEPPAPIRNEAVVQPVQDLRADYLLVDKSDRTLTLFREGIPLRTYGGLAFGDAPFGHKRFEGDERTPEGIYTIDTRNPRSAYHLSLRISYPNAADRANAAQYGRSAGGDIFIHGQPNRLADRGGNFRLPGDWTDGCIAISNLEMRELWNAVADGTPIEIRQ